MTTQGKQELLLQELGRIFSDYHHPVCVKCHSRIITCDCELNSESRHSKKELDVEAVKELLFDAMQKAAHQEYDFLLRDIEKLWKARDEYIAKKAEEFCAKFSPATASKFDKWDKQTCGNNTEEESEYPEPKATAGVDDIIWPEKTKCHKEESFGCGGCIKNKAIDACKKAVAESKGGK